MVENNLVFSLPRTIAFRSAKPEASLDQSGPSNLNSPQPAREADDFSQLDEIPSIRQSWRDQIAEMESNPLFDMDRYYDEPEQQCRLDDSNFPLPTPTITLTPTATDGSTPTPSI